MNRLYLIGTKFSSLAFPQENSTFGFRLYDSHVCRYDNGLQHGIADDLKLYEYAHRTSDHTNATEMIGLALENDGGLYINAKWYNHSDLPRITGIETGRSVVMKPPPRVPPPLVKDITGRRRTKRSFLPPPGNHDCDAS